MLAIPGISNNDQRQNNMEFYLIKKNVCYNFILR